MCAAGLLSHLIKLPHFRIYILIVIRKKSVIDLFILLLDPCEAGIRSPNPPTFLPLTLDRRIRDKCAEHGSKYRTQYRISKDRKRVRFICHTRGLHQFHRNSLMCCRVVGVGSCYDRRGNVMGDIWVPGSHINIYDPRFSPDLCLSIICRSASSSRVVPVRLVQHLFPE